MPTLLAVACATPEEAERALAALRTLDAGVADAALVERTASGRLELHQEQQLAPGEGIVGGGSAGLVAGLLLGFPVAGALVGMLGGGVWGARDTGVDDAELRELGGRIGTGEAMLCALVERDDAPRVRAELERYGEVVDVEVSPAAP